MENCFSIVVVIPTKKKKCQHMQQFLENMKPYAQNIILIDENEFFSLKQVNVEFDSHVQHILIHKPLKILYSYNKQVIDNYNNFISSIPNLLQYDTLDSISQLLNRDDINHKIKQNDILKDCVVQQPHCQLSDNNDLIRIYNITILDEYGSQSQNLIEQTNSYSQVHVLKKRQSSNGEISHIMYFLQLNLNNVQLNKHYQLEQYIQSQYIFKIYSFNSENLVIRKHKHLLDDQIKSQVIDKGKILSISSQEFLIYDKKVTELVTWEEKEKIQVITNQLFKTFKILYISYDIVQDENTKQFYIIDVNYLSLPQKGDELDAKILNFYSLK